MEIRGTRLLLRYPAASDADRLFDLAQDPQVAGWFSWGPYTDRRQPAAWIAAQADEREAGRHLDFVVVHPDDGVVGITGLNELSDRDRRVNVGSWLGREWWGTGVNARAKELVAHLAFAVLGMERLGAYTNVENERSARALERLGYAREGTLRAFHRHGDRQLDVHVHALLRASWSAGPQTVTVTGVPPAAWCG